MKSFTPKYKLLLGPGPSNIHPRVLQSMSAPILGHLDPDFIGMMDDLKGMLRIVFGTKNEFTLPISAPGSAGMEFCFANLVEPGDKVVICKNGVFGQRMKENVERCGGIPILVEEPFGKPLDLNKIEDALQKNSDAKILSFVHAETSTGVQSFPKEVVSIARKFNCLTIVDTVTSLGGIPVTVDEWEADAVYSGTQKCLSCVPGLSPVTLNDRALGKIKNRKSKIQSWFLDANLLSGYWTGSNKRMYHHTAPINSLYALHEALVLLLEEGLENSYKRHFENHLYLKQGLESLGILFLVEEKYRLPQLNSVIIPNSIDDVSTRTKLLVDYNIEIGAGLGDLAGKIWRIGLMGYSSTKANINILLNALRSCI